MKKTILCVLVSVLASLAGGYPGMQQEAAGMTGVVCSTEDAGSYTYVELDISGEKVWFAAPKSSAVASRVAVSVR